jgi:phage-related protein
MRQPSGGDKECIFLGSVLYDLRQFRDDARQVAGHEIYALQRGLMPSKWKPMPSIGPGAAEIIIHTGQQSEDYRVFYVAKFAEAVYILHAFEKKTQSTRQADIDRGRQRYREMQRHRTAAGHSERKKQG